MKTLDEYIAQAMLLDMKYDVRDHTFNKDKEVGTSICFDADTLELLYSHPSGTAMTADYPDGWVRVFKQRVLAVQAGTLGPTGAGSTERYHTLPAYFSNLTRRTPK